MKLVNRNKQKMSAAYKRAKKRIKVICRPEYHDGYGDMTNEIRRLFWDNGGWWAKVYNSVYG